MTYRHRASVLRHLAVLAAAAMMLSLLPLAGTALAQDGPLDGCPVDAPQADFDDRQTIPDAHAGNVDCAAELGIVEGFPDGEYKPRLPVTRAQMAAFIFRALQAAEVTLPAPAAERFQDVGPGATHDEAIHRLAAAGIVEGGPLNMGEEFYGPQLQTRRDQMASFLMRAAGYAFFDDPEHFADTTGQRFPDVPATNVHFGNVNAASETGIAQGFEDGQYRPRATTRRDQMASFVVRLLNFLAVPHEVAITRQSAEAALPGETITVTATVSDQFGNPWGAGEEVHFQAEGEAVEPETATVTTDQDGEADFAFTSAEEETVTVTAAIDGPGGNFANADGDADSVEKTFTADLPTFTLTVHTHTHGIGGPGGADTLFETEPVPAPVTDAEEGVAYSYSAIPCEDAAPFNDVALMFRPGYPGVDSPDAVRHFLELTITDMDDEEGTGTIEGELRTILCENGEESDNEIHFDLAADFALAGPNLVELTDGTWAIAAGSGIFDTLEGDGQFEEGRLTCLPAILGPDREDAEHCEELGIYTDAVGIVLEGDFADPSPGAED